MSRPTGNYLSNRELLAEIHKSKTSYCFFLDEKFHDYDIIESNIPEKASIEADYTRLPITTETIERGRIARATRLQKKAFHEALGKFHYGKKPKESEFKIDPASIEATDVVFRVLTYQHIPRDNDRKRTHRSYADMHPRLNFIPFKHYILCDEASADISYMCDGQKLSFKEVGRSHHDKDGNFNLTSGAITKKLANMYLLLVERYSEKSNWRGYSYVDEMKGAALVQLTYAGLHFNEAKSDNPFSYLTSFMSNSFTRVLNIEKQNQMIRDDMLIEMGQDASWTRQFEHEESIRKGREEANLKDISDDDCI